MFIRTLITTLLQIFSKIILNFHVSASLKDANHDFNDNSIMLSSSLTSILFVSNNFNLILENCTKHEIFIICMILKFLKHKNNFSFLIIA